MKKCAICGKEINGGFLVEIECLKELQKDIKRQTDIKDKLKEHNAELKRIIKADLKKIEELVAENAELKARLEKAVELPLKIGSSFWYFDSDGVLRHHIMQANVCGYSESEWQGSVNQGKDHRFIIFHNSYNQPFAVELKNCFHSCTEAEARLKELEGK